MMFEGKMGVQWCFFRLSGLARARYEDVNEEESWDLGLAFPPEHA